MTAADVRVDAQGEFGAGILRAVFFESVKRSDVEQDPAFLQETNVV
jgi:hypothetical protein